MTTATAAAPAANVEAKTQPQQLAKREIPLDANGIVRLSSYEDAFRFANSVLKSGMAPTSFRTPEAVLVAMQHGAELGLKPLQSLHSIAVVQGKPSLYGKALPALVMRSGLLEIFEEWTEGDGDDLTAICKVKRKGFASERVERFSVADAKRAKLWGKPGPWTDSPRT